MANPRSFDYLSLDQGGKIQAMYVWIDGTGIGLRCKTRTLPYKEGGYKPEELPDWNYDGSSTGQAPGGDSEIIMKPAAVFRDPFRRGDNILVMCDTYYPDGRPHETNHRAPAMEIFNNPKVKNEKPWYGIEQEFTLFSMDKWPLGWPHGGYPAPQGPFYCSAGADVAYGRPIVEGLYRACLYAGVNISGTNGEVMPGQWEFQVGPCEGIDIGDHLWMGRFLLNRVAELHDVVVSYDPKPIPGDWNGAGCHCNYSTESMRNDGGYDKIIEAIERLSKKHFEHIAVYGAGNERRLTGLHETASMDKFSYGVADRGASVRIPRTTEAAKKGYFEDRRPASNIDPYVVASKIADTTILGE